MRRGGQVRSVLIDEHAGGRAVTEYLLGLGHATVHHVSIPVLGGAPGRTEGWHDALVATGAPVPEILRASW